MLDYTDQSQKGLVTGSVNVEPGGDPNYAPQLRNCLVHFVDPSKYPTTVNILHSTVIENYVNIYSNMNYMDLSTIQYVKYKEGDFFKKHSDVITGGDRIRMLTMSINMSDPSEYEGGELVIYYNNKKTVLCKELGSFIIFPSFLLHECKLVTRGVRHAIVTWTLDEILSLNEFKDYYDSINT